MIRDGAYVSSIQEYQHITLLALSGVVCQFVPFLQVTVEAYFARAQSTYNRLVRRTHENENRSESWLHILV